MIVPVRVLIADDSALFADALGRIVMDDPELDLVGIAPDGRRAVELAQTLSPHIITMDVSMPVMNGLDAIQEIMAVCPVPILCMTSDPRGETGELSFEALKRGAMDLMPKPLRWPGAPSEQEELRARIKALSKVPAIHHRRQRVAATRPQPQASAVAAKVLTPAPESSRQIVAFVGSTGGPGAFSQILSRLSPRLALSVVIVQHLASGFTENFAAWLDHECPLEVRCATADEALRPGRVLVAPDDVHMLVQRPGRISLRSAPPVGGHRPSGDLLLKSVAECYGPAAVGVVLTGMGSDGAEGLLAIRERGGHTIAQDEASSLIYGMPKAAVESGAVRQVIGVQHIAGAINHLGPQRGGREA